MICCKDFDAPVKPGPRPKICLPCKPEAQRRRLKKFRDANGSPASSEHRKRNLKSKYDLTLKQYEELLASVDSKCSVCFSDEKLVVDHDHKSNRVRSILCNSCNLSLGWAKDNPEILRKLADYAERHSP